MTVSTHVRIDDELVQGALNRARLDMNRRVRDGLKAAAQRVTLPRVKAVAASITAPYLFVGATNRGAYITTRGPKVYDRIAGLLEFGSKGVTSDIYPKNKQAVMTPWGPRAAVYRGPFVGKPQVVKAQHRIQKGVVESLPGMASAVEPEILRAFGSLAV